MPQGSPKKIEVDLLLTDLALQLGDLAARRLRLIRLALPGPRPRAQRLRLARPAGAAHRLRSALLVLAVPLVQPPAVHPDRPGHRRHCLAIRHPGDRRALLFFREISMLLHPVPLYEKLSAVSCLTFGGRYRFSLAMHASTAVCECAEGGSGKCGNCANPEAGFLLSWRPESRRARLVDAASVLGDRHCMVAFSGCRAHRTIAHVAQHAPRIAGARIAEAAAARRQRATGAGAVALHTAKNFAHGPAGGAPADIGAPAPGLLSAW